MDKPVGFIGLGIMGRPIASNLCKAGFPVMVYDVNPEACVPLEQLGAKRSSMRDIAETCDVIMMILPNGAIVHSVLFDEGGLCENLRAGTLVCDMSSVSTAQAVSHAKELSERCGAAYIDSPVSGGEMKAISGKLTIMMGGSEEQFQTMLPYYSAISAACHRVGPVGQGCLAKLCNQIIVTSNIAAICEATAFAEKHGMELSLLFDVLRIGSADSAMLESRIPKILERNFRPGGAIKTHLKDIRNVLAEAEAVGVDLPISDLLCEMLAEHEADGNGLLDSSSLLLYFEKKLGV